ncbi:IS200/IS605 family transposase, partial [Klebsiella pneumoniae]|nr:IS200/IS605 family transposase [Klebsiella pneumoniae]
ILHRLMSRQPIMGPTPIRGRRLGVVREEFAWLRSRLPTLWTNSYFVATVGGFGLS